MDRTSSTIESRPGVVAVLKCVLAPLRQSDIAPPNETLPNAIVDRDTDPAPPLRERQRATCRSKKTGWHALDRREGRGGLSLESSEAKTKQLPLLRLEPARQNSKRGNPIEQLMASFGCDFSSEFRVGFRCASLILSFLLASISLTLSGCADSEAEAVRQVSQEEGEDQTKRSKIEFEYVRDSNASYGPVAESLVFTDAAGHPVTLDDLAEGRSVVLIITRGPITADPNGPVCPACTTQTQRYIERYNEFENRNTEVVVVYPQIGTGKNAFEMFLEQVRTQYKADKSGAPFPIVFDYDHKAVEKLGLLSDPVKPSTFLYDADHHLKFAYVGETPLERPSVQSILDEIDSWSGEPASSSTASTKPAKAGDEVDGL